MSILESIMSKIFGRARAEQRRDPQAPPATAQQSAEAGNTQIQQGGGRVQETVDVEAVLTRMAAHNSQKLNWRTSIVDLMKLLGLDSSLDERKELARELGYTGDTSDTATMNIWLHKQVMEKLAQNGGKVPAELRN